MWWILSLFSLVSIFLYFNVIRPLHREVMCAKLSYNGIFYAISLVDGNFRFDEKFRFSNSIFNDYYLIGYIHGYLSTVIETSGFKLSAVQNGRVVNTVLRKFTKNKSKSIVDKIKELSNTNDVDYTIGVKQGMNVSLLAVNCASSSVLSEPDVQLALRESPKFQKELEILSRARGKIRFGQTGAAALLLSVT